MKPTRFLRRAYSLVDIFCCHPPLVSPRFYISSPSQNGLTEHDLGSAAPLCRRRVFRVLQFFHGVVFVPVVLSILPDSVVSHSPRHAGPAAIINEQRRDQVCVCTVVARLLCMPSSFAFTVACDLVGRCSFGGHGAGACGCALGVVTIHDAADDAHVRTPIAPPLANLVRKTCIS